MKKRIASIFTVLTMLLMLVPAGVFADGPISYLDADGMRQECNEYTLITSSTTTLNDGCWYVV